MGPEFFAEVAELLASGHALAIATVIASQGSTPRRAGAKMIVLESGGTRFTVGGGAFEALVIDDAREALRAGAGGEKEYRFAEHGEGASGMVCGGSVRVLIEVTRPPERLIIFGGGHVGREVAHLGARLGFTVTVVDDRPEFLDPSRYPAGVAMARVEHDFGAGLPPILPGAFVAIVTRCHRTDLAAVRHAVGRGAAYVGLIGSRRKIATVMERAREQGSAPAALAEVRGPIGLPIGAETPQEIAVSIVAEIVGVRRAGAAFGRAAARRVPLKIAEGAPAPRPRRASQPL